MPVIADRDDARLLHGADFRKALAAASDGRRADGPDVRAGHRSRALQDRASHRSIVVDGPRVGHGAHSREAAACRGTRPAFDGFRTLAAGFAQVAVQIDESGSDHQAGGVERFPVRRAICAGRIFRRRDPRDAPGVDPNIAIGVRAAGRIEQAAVLNVQHERILWPHRLPSRWPA